MKHNHKYLLLISIFILYCAAAAAQSGGTYEITQSVIANGGGKSADAIYAIEGTIGQHAAGSVSSNAPYSFRAGFWQSFLTPTAATVSISGRVVTANGNPVRGSRVILTSTRGGFATTAVTSSFGYYQLEGVEVGQSYLLEVTTRGLQFEPRILSVLDELTGLDLIVF